MRKLTQISALQNAGILAHTTSSVVGQSLKHESAVKQVNGQAVYVDDNATPKGCLHGALILGDKAKGLIEELDLSDVHKSRGVVKVICYEDIPGQTDIGPIHKGDPLLANKKIRFHKQVIALVLARTHRQAWQAASKAKLSIQAQVPNIDFAQAQQQRHLLEPRQFGTASNYNEVDTHQIEISGELSIGGQEHFYLEGQVALAQPTEDGGMFVQCSSQHPTEVQTLIAEVLAIPFNQVTVDMRRMGGGFGGKETQAAQWACLASLGAKLANKPVKIRLPRSVDMQTTGKRHPFVNSYSLKASQNGEIQASQVEVNGLCGHSADLSAAIVDRAMFHSDNAYSLGQSHIIGNRLRTDTVSHTAFRGFGGPQGMITIEKALQDLSIHCQQDALDVRLKNLYRLGANTTPYGMEVEQTSSLKTIMERLEQQSEYRKRRLAVKEWNKNNLVLKKGLALSPVKFGIAFTATHLNQAGALVHVYTDGSVQVNHGGTEMGQGLHTKIAQIVAQTLGLPIELILVTSTRTDKVPNSSPTAASSGTDLNGMAAHNAASAIRQRLIDFAKQHYGLEQSIEITGGRLTSGQFSISWTKLIQAAYLARVSLSSHGFYKTPKIWFDLEKGIGRPFFYFSLGASCSQVTIDTLTGEMVVDYVDIIHDVGNSINPAIDNGQIEGAFIQGMGWLTTEELLWNEEGQLLSNSPMNYKIPSIGDYPKQMNISLFGESNPEHSIYRSKAIGEPPFMHAISLWCAIYDAVASISSHTIPAALNAPATGEAILAACHHQFESIGYTRSELKEFNHE